MTAKTRFAVVLAVVAFGSPFANAEVTVVPDNRNLGRSWTKEECERQQGRKIIVSFQKEKNLFSVCVRGCSFSKDPTTQTKRDVKFQQATFIASGSLCSS